MILSLLLAAVTFASTDSVAVFHRPEKVVVLLNERGDGRIHQMMDAWGAGEDLFWESEDKAFYLNCARRTEVATCTLRLLPGAGTHIGEKESFSEIFLAGVEKAPLFAIQFEGSRGHFFQLAGVEGRLFWHAKRP